MIVFAAIGVGAYLVFGPERESALPAGKNAQLVEEATEPIEEVAKLAVDEITNWETYRSEEYEFEFKYPSHYIIRQRILVDEDNDIPLFVRVYEDKNGNGLWDSGSPPLNANEEEQQVILEPVEFSFHLEVTPDESRAFISYEAPLKSAIEVAGKDTTVYAFPDGYGGSVPFAEVILRKGDYFYIIGVVSTAEFEGVGGQMLSSFKFTQ